MAFDDDGLGVLAYCNGFTFWHYRSSVDGAAAVAANGYFNPAAALLRWGDVVLVQDRNNATGLRCVSLHSDGQVNTAALA